MRIFAEVPGKGASNDSGVVVGFPVISKCMTLNDLKWLFRVKFCFRAGLAG